MEAPQSEGDPVTDSTPEGRASSAAALRARLAELDRDLTARLVELGRDLRARDDDLAASLGRQTNDLTELRDIVAALTDQVASLQSGGRYTAAPNWLALAEDDAQYRVQRAALVKWVDGFLRPTYGCQEIQDCWRYHARAIWELGNIWAEWCRIYDRDRPELAGALAWHDRWLPGALRRLEPVMLGCLTTCAERRTRNVA